MAAIKKRGQARSALSSVRALGGIPLPHAQAAELGLVEVASLCALMDGWVRPAGSARRVLD